MHEQGLCRPLPSCRFALSITAAVQWNSRSIGLAVKVLRDQCQSK
jgi:hypothetical protein